PSPAVASVPRAHPQAGTRTCRGPPALVRVHARVGDVTPGFDVVADDLGEPDGKPRDEPVVRWPPAALGPPDAGTDPPRGQGVGIAQEHGELVTPDPRHEIPLAGARREEPRRGAEERVAGRVAVPVIRRLEAVEVAAQDVG